VSHYITRQKKKKNH